MPSGQDDILSRLPPLRNAAAFDRPVSMPEYYHACIGTSPRTLEGPRDVIFALEGELDGGITPAQWQQALDRVTEANPGLRMRWHGSLGWSRWRCDGPPPRLRLIDDCAWDARSNIGAGFITETPLSLTEGPVVELIVARQSATRGLVILRTVHAVMDGSGGYHTLRELFRALRGEPLQGSNATFSDVDLLKAIAAPAVKPEPVQTCWLTGAPDGDATGDDWWRIPLGPARSQLLGRVAVAMAAFAHTHSTLPVRIAVPVDLRRHAPGLLATTNFSSMLFVTLQPGDGIDVFREQLRAQLAVKREAAYSSLLDLFRWLPLSWLDRMLGRTLANYRNRRVPETALISSLGVLDPAEFSARGFTLDGMSVVPMAGTVFTVLMVIGGQAQLMLNLPRVLSGQGRREALIAHLQASLATA